MPREKKIEENRPTDPWDDATGLYDLKQARKSPSTSAINTLNISNNTTSTIIFWDVIG